MPDVTIDVSHYERYELKTAPPDGFVMLRALPYGMKLTRRDKATRMMMKQEEAGGRGRRRSNEPMNIELETLNEWANSYDFAYCIGDHNLTDKNGTLLDFTNPMTLKILNPKVGSEIEKYIGELNEDEDEESLEDFMQRHTSSSETKQPSSETDSGDTKTLTEVN